MSMNALLRIHRRQLIQVAQAAFQTVVSAALSGGVRNSDLTNPASIHINDLETPAGNHEVISRSRNTYRTGT